MKERDKIKIRKGIKEVQKVVSIQEMKQKSKTEQAWLYLMWAKYGDYTDLEHIPETDEEGMLLKEQSVWAIYSS